MCFLKVTPLDERGFWRRLLERPLKQRDERGLMRLQVGPVGGSGHSDLGLLLGCRCVSKQLFALCFDPACKGRLNLRLNNQSILQLLMGALALRRTKTTPGAGGQPLVQLPPKTTMLLKVGGAWGR